MQPGVTFAAILGLSIVLSVSIYVFARVRIEQERTLQKLIERGLSGDELLKAAGFGGRGGKDLRRGLLLIGVGLSWSVVTFFIGGTAWMLEGVVGTLLLVTACSLVWIGTEPSSWARIARMSERGLNRLEMRS